MFLTSAGGLSCAKVALVCDVCVFVCVWKCIFVSRPLPQGLSCSVNTRGRGVRKMLGEGEGERKDSYPNKEDVI